MATSKLQKAPCVTCGKVGGLFTCRGCQQDFCTRHVAEHRQELGKQMEELTLEHDQFRHQLNEQTTNLQQNSLMKEIDAWEQESIDKIYCIADDIRRRLEIAFSEHTSKLTSNLIKTAEELSKARDDDDYAETDLRRWMEELDKLRKELAQPLNIAIRRNDDKGISLTVKLTEVESSKEIFKQSAGKVRIEDNGQVIIKNSSSSHATIRGNSEYSTGQYRLQFKLEEYSSPGWILIGIVSKSATIQETSHNTSSFYGWAGHGQVYQNGTICQGFEEYTTDIKKDDIVELLVNCDDRIIRLTNERTLSRFQLKIDIKLCPFPWQLNVGLYHANDRVRILHT